MGTEAWIAAVAVIVGLIMIYVSPFYIPGYMQRHMPSAPSKYSMGYIIIYMTIGFFVLVAGMVILASAFDVKRDGWADWLFFVAFVVMVAGIYKGLQLLDEAKRHLREGRGL